jgi:hypothetical protein
MLSPKSGTRLSDDGDIVRALGLVIMYFAHLNYTLNECVDIVSLIHKFSKPKQKRPTFEQKRRHMLNFRKIAEGPEADLAIVDEFLRSCRLCAIGRNKLAHWQIVSNLKRKTIDMISPDDPDKVENVNSAQFYALAQDILDTSHVGGHAKNSIARRITIKQEDTATGG